MDFNKRAPISIGCLSSLASLLRAAGLEPNWQTLSTRATPYQTRILDVGTTFYYQENNCVWQLIEYVANQPLHYAAIS